jgi:signal transduction histidine kinase
VHDDGRGFDLAEVNRTAKGRGLESMRERVGLVDGWLDVKTAPGSGTTISATVPLDSGPEIVH